MTPSEKGPNPLIFKKFSKISNVFTILWAQILLEIELRGFEKQFLISIESRDLENAQI